MSLVLSALLFASCKSEGEMVPKVYTFTKENVMKTVPANWTKSVDIKLQTSDSVYFDCSSKMVLNDRDIFVSMYKKPIYHFDKKGQLLNKVGGIGHSKNEYSEVSVESNVSRETSSGKVSLPDSECAGILFHVKQRVCI
jgi:hypothetical protein